MAKPKEDSKLERDQSQAEMQANLREAESRWGRSSTRKITVDISGDGKAAGE